MKDATLSVIDHPKIELGHPELVAAEREYCRRGMANFIKRAWHVIEPAQEYSHGWHIDAICEHLQAVHKGEINRLAIAVPPGSMKSLSSSVLFPAWEWGPMEKPATRTIATSHSENLAVRDNLRAKRLIDSDWFKSRWPEVELSKDQSSKTNFENTHTGFRQASPFTSLTGKRGDRVIVDDPLSVDGANSDQVRQKVMETFTRSASPARSWTGTRKFWAATLSLLSSNSYRSPAKAACFRQTEFGSSIRSRTKRTLFSAEVGTLRVLRALVHSLQGVCWRTPEKAADTSLLT